MKRENFTKNSATAKNLTIIAILSLVLLITLSGCKGPFSTGSSFGSGLGGLFKGKQPEQIEVYNPQSGSEAISIEFIENMPPDPVYMCSDFNFGLEVKNLGATDIDAKKSLFLIGAEDEFSFVEGTSKDLALRGKSALVKQGDETVVFFPATSKLFEAFKRQRSLNYTTNVKAIACIPYATKANADVCINPDVLSKDKQGCTPQTVSLSGGQGGPVGVTKVNPQMIAFGSTVKARIDVSLKKVSSEGRIYALGALSNQCQTATQLNKVKVKVLLGSEEMTCDPSGLVNLYDNKESTVSCTTTLGHSSGAYTTPVTVLINYTYYLSKGKEFKIALPPGTTSVDTLNCAAYQGQRQPVIIDCSVSPDGTDCGDNMICKDKECIDECRATGQGVCIDQSLNCPTADTACLTRIGCKKGLCPGEATYVCCS